MPNFFAIAPKGRKHDVTMAQRNAVAEGAHDSQHGDRSQALFSHPRVPATTRIPQHASTRAETRAVPIFQNSSVYPSIHSTDPLSWNVHPHPLLIHPLVIHHGNTRCIHLTLSTPTTRGPHYHLPLPLLLRHQYLSPSLWRPNSSDYGGHEQATSLNLLRMQNYLCRSTPSLLSEQAFLRCIRSFLDWLCYTHQLLRRQAEQYQTSDASNPRSSEQSKNQGAQAPASSRYPYHRISLAIEKESILSRTEIRYRDREWPRRAKD
jgi:hypothetical protein